MIQSGLDSESALGLLKYLHSYARGKDRKTGKGRRVILTIHQPSSQIWENIDNGNDVADVDYSHSTLLNAHIPPVLHTSTNSSSCSPCRGPSHLPRSSQRND